MAQPQARTRPQFRGVSTDALEAAQKAATALLPTLQLPIRGGQIVEFELQVIQPEQIAELTEVDGENYRNQALLNQYALDDILPTITSTGQQWPAFGFRQDKIRVVDGSRRRRACVIAAKPYYIYVTNTEISADDVRYLSKIANISKPLSLYERGALFERLLTSGEYPDNKTLAAGEGEHESIVSLALRIHRLVPQAWVEMMPSAYDIGRPSWQQLLKWAEDEKTKELITSKLLAAGSPDTFWKYLALKTGSDQSEPVSTDAMNKAFVSYLTEICTTKKPAAPPPAILASKGKVKASVVKSKKDGFTVQISGIDEKIRSQLETAIQKVIEGSA